MQGTTSPTRSRAARIALLAGAAILALIGLAVTGGGGTLLWADVAKRDADGYFSTGKHAYRSDGRAITTKDVTIGTDVPEWLLGKIRIRASSGDGRRLFVGIARRADVDRYLAGVDRSVVTDVEFDPFEATYEPRAGTRTPAAPGTQTFWAASATGTGSPTVSWPLESGHWSAVVMNADGSPGVEADVKAGAKIPYALWFGIGLAIGGLLVLAASAAMTYFGTRGSGPPAVTAGRTPRTPAGPAPSAPAASS